MKWIAVLLVACASKAPAASGAMMLDVAPTATRDALDAEVANAIEMLRGPMLRDRVSHERGMPFDGAIVAHRRGDSTVIEVGVELADPLAAAAACNQLMRAFYEMRLEARIAGGVDRANRLEEMADKLPKGDPQRDKLDAEVAQLERDRELSQSDVKLIEPCQPRR